VKRFGGLVVVLLVVFVAALFGTELPAGAADGRQSPDPTLDPSEVATASAGFALSVPGNASCDGTGSEGWRANTFIVNDGVDIASLDFTVPGLPAGWVGADFDSASDGTVAAPLFRTSGSAVSMIPAVRPAGQINPSALAGFTFEPTTWNLADGDYQVGFACTGPTSEIRQWWATAVTISTSSSSFMTAVSAAGKPPTTTVSTAIDEPLGSEANTTDSAPPNSAAFDAGDGATDESSAPGQGRGGSGATPDISEPAGRSSWATVVVVLVVTLLVVALISYLLARPGRAPRAATAARRPEGTTP
jgi:hypothetical protein